MTKAEIYLQAAEVVNGYKADLEKTEDAFGEQLPDSVFCYLRSSIGELDKLRVALEESARELNEEGGEDAR